MSIRLDHTHEDGKQCFRITGQHKLTEPARVRLNGRWFSVARMPYTGSYYAWNDEGKEIAQFSRDLYFWFVKPFIVCELKFDPDCVPTRKTAA